MNLPADVLVAAPPSAGLSCVRLCAALSGVLLFKVDGVETVVRAGEVMQIPGNAAHEVEVLEDALVIDVFCPIRQDWIDKTDSYFRR